MFPASADTLHRVTHIHERFDFVVSVFIVCNAKVMLVRRPQTDKWLPVHGHIELDEDPEQALFREVTAETGLGIAIVGRKPDMPDSDVTFLHAPWYVDVRSVSRSHKHIQMVYFAAATRQESPRRHLDVRWVGVDDLDASECELPTSVEFYCREAIAAVGRALSQG
jgi:8-oxo-dGTP pyrophosphatase MutT (NUDIX family)